MKLEHHPLLPTPGSTRSITSEHFGARNGSRKIYIQAALHADETPALLLATVLRRHLMALEEAGELLCEVVLVAMANPPGLTQWVMGFPSGRFELGSGRNYNRNFPIPFERVAAAVAGNLVDDPDRNRDTIRSAWHDALRDWRAKDEFESLQRHLMLLAHDADVVLDLHCSREATMHLYTAPALWPALEPLARLLSARAVLLAVDSGAQSFDEAMSLMWWKLAERFSPAFPIPHASVSATVELRGQRDVSHAFAEQDAQAIIDYLCCIGVVDRAAPHLPPLLLPATPLAGSEQFTAHVAGILVHRADVGAKVNEGDAMFDIVSPETGEVSTIYSQTSGVFYMRRDTRFVRVGDPLGRVTGNVGKRTGMLLGA